jgi:PhnB protein
MIILNPYIHFNGEARAAMEFYQSIFGGKLDFSTYGETSSMPVEDKYKDQIMHSDLQTDDFRLMASDSGPMGQGKVGDNMSISLSGDDKNKLTEHYNGLADGGNVTVPMSKQAWGDEFGMLIDKFGTKWLVNINEPK